ncbi:hypothetical protein NUW58_g3036 [Xylaria curta]|uniref:Uncharacterized protein n=1 Tax=Xylaria curta TaxID=42375 RepID=A0ACC1PF52_9PEZI|nr:hypothetical protein NUW58_g3036 [Xylaria curta]
MAPYTQIPSRPRLNDFVDENRVQSLTINVNLSDQTREDLIRHKGGIPKRRPSFFGCERQVDLDDLESAVIEFIQSCNSTKLVLIGFEMPAEWTYLLRNFPKAIPYFSFWIDLRDIAKDITAIGVIPGRVSVLQTLGYHWKDIKGFNKQKHGSADNAGNDAVSVLAMANAFLSPENQEKLQFRQKCDQIAQYTFNKKKIIFGATIQSQNMLLPGIINSPMKLARYFFDFMPISTRLEYAEIAFITFGNITHLNHFIQKNDQPQLATGEILSVIPVIKRSTGIGEATGREEKQRLRAIKKAERLEYDIDLNEGYMTILEPGASIQDTQ